MAKRGRPKGSKNKNTKKQRRRDDATAADDAFGEAFSNVPPIENISEVIDCSERRRVGHDNDLEETERFGMDLLPVGHEEDDGFDDDEENSGREEAATTNDEYEDNVGFGSADMYDVEELIELANMDLKERAKKDSDIDRNSTTDEIIKDLRVGCVSSSSKRLYESSNVLFLFYHFKFNKHLMHKTWIKTINSFSHGITDEAKKNRSIKKTIRKLLQKADETCPPMDFKLYTAKDFLIYLLSLQNKKKKRLSSASYNGKSSSYFHLCRLYGYKQSEEFMGQITVLFRGLKRCITKEKQDGDGKIQTGKIPMSFSLYRYIMNTCYVMTLLNLFLLVHFLLQLGILSAVQQTRAPSIYTTWITMKKNLAVCSLW